MTQISEECFGLAGSLFLPWVHIDAARRHAAVEEKEKALSATINLQFRQHVKAGKQGNRINRG